MRGLVNQILSPAHRGLPTACSSVSKAFAVQRTAVRSIEAPAGPAAGGANCTATIPSGSQQQGRQRGSYRAAQVVAAAVGSSQAMEVEVKLRLPNKQAHQQLQQLLLPGKVATHQQENYFFDGPNRELNSKRVVLRLRFYDKDRKAELTLKGKQLLVDGIGRATEINEPIDAVAARRYLEEPSQLLQLPSDMIQNLAKQYDLSSLISLGGFNNTRQEVQWHGFTLELDETVYPWGTLYELEAETDKPEELRSQLEELLQKEGIQYSHSATSKFANFINKTLV